MSFADLKKKSGNFEKLQTELEKVNNPVTSFADDRFWKPELDESGNGYAIIRFLPQPGDENLPWCKIWSHAFNGPGGWYIENSLTTLSKKDPVSEYNTELWNSGLESDKDTARKQKRILKYYSNILVVSDAKHPENEGKVFLFRFGKKIFDKISSMSNPEFEDETEVNVFNLWDGANFKLKIRKVDGFSNYDKSEFMTPGPLFEDELEMERVFGEQHDLEEFIDQKSFKTYDELKTRLDTVLGNIETPAMTAPTSVENDDVPFDGGTPIPESSTSGDENLDYFKKLAEA